MGQSFAAFFLANFDAKYSLLEVYLADNDCEKMPQKQSHTLKWCHSCCFSNALHAVCERAVGHDSLQYNFHFRLN